MVGKDAKISKAIDKTLEILKWGVISSIALLISSYMIIKLGIVNNFLAILFSAAIVSIIIQIVKSHHHEFHFKMRWFIFYFLVYTTIIWVIREYLIPQSISQNIILSSVIIGFVIAVIIVIIREIGIKSRTIPWISFVLILILLVSNLGSLISSDFSLDSQNPSTVLESGRACPSPKDVLQEFESIINSNSTISALNSLIDKDVWRVENVFNYCYKGKYSGQHLDWFYCDNMIVSRWETGSSGTIKYRWYTAVTAEWRPQNVTSNSVYVLDSFKCENGKKVIVNKETPEFYVYDSKDGTKIRIDVLRDSIDINTRY